MVTALTAYPFDNVDTTEAQYATLFRQLQDDGIVADPAGTAGQVTVSSGFLLNVNAFTAYTAGVISALTGPTTLLMDAAAGTQRIDRVIIRVNWATNSATVDKLTGTAGATVPPALTQTPGQIWELSLARVTVPANAANIGVGNLTDERVFTSGRYRRYTSTSRPTGVLGDVGFNYTSKRLEFHNGSTWLTVNAS